MSFIVYIQAVLAVLVVLAILLQQRAAGLSNASGGSGGAQVQRRGAELFLYRSAIVMSVLFLALTLVDWYV